jgi:hypothetical protein
MTLIKRTETQVACHVDNSFFTDLLCSRSSQQPLGVKEGKVISRNSNYEFGIPVLEKRGDAIEILSFESAGN